MRCLLSAVISLILCAPAHADFRDVVLQFQQQFGKGEVSDQTRAWVQSGVVVEPTSIAPVFGLEGRHILENTIEILHVAAYPFPARDHLTAVGHTYLRAANHISMVPLAEHPATYDTTQTADHFFNSEFIQNSIAHGVVYGVNFEASPEQIAQIIRRDVDWRPQVRHRGDSMTVHGNEINCAAFCTRLLADTIGIIAPTLYPPEAARLLLDSPRVSHLTVYSAGHVAAQNDFEVAGLLQRHVPFTWTDLLRVSLRFGKTVRVDGSSFWVDANGFHPYPGNPRNDVAVSRYLWSHPLPAHLRPGRRR